jgi:hypothetical protein
LPGDVRDRSTVIARRRTRESSRGGRGAELVGRVGDTDDLEGVQAEALCLIFRIDVANASGGRQMGKRAERGRPEVGARVEKRADLCILVVAEEPAKSVIALNRDIDERAQLSRDPRRERSNTGAMRPLEHLGAIGV